MSGPLEIAIRSMNGNWEIVIIIVVAIVMSGLHFLSHWISDHLVRYRSQILSLSAGLLVSILFLVIMEEVFTHTIELHLSPQGHFLKYVTVFMGFLIFHLIEKTLFKTIKKQEELEKDLKEFHLVGLFIDHFFLGVILATSFSPSEPLSYFILIPLFLESISSTISLEHIDKCTYKQGTLGKILLGLAPILGAVLAIVLGINEIVTLYITAFTLGAVLYIAIRDVIPHNKEGKPLWFLLGTIITLVIAFINFIPQFT